jgi:ATP-dependent DNA helicase RecG
MRLCAVCTGGPKAEADLSSADLARQQLANDEILASQLAVALVRARRRQPGRTIHGTGALAGLAEARLGFALTAAQRYAISRSPPTWRGRSA